MGFPLATVCLAPSVRNRNREAFSRPKSVCRRGAAEGAVWGLQVQTRAEERPRSKSRYLVLGPWGPGGWAPGTRPSPCHASLCRGSEGRGSPRGRAENPLLGLIVPRRVWGGRAGHIHPGATHRQRPPGSTLTPSGLPFRPSASAPHARPPGPATGLLPTPKKTPGLRGSHTVPGRRASAPPARGSTPALPPPPRPSSASPPAPRSRLPGRVRKRVRPLPRPPPGPGPPPPRRRTCPLPGRPRARDRDPAERSRRASAAPPARAPSGSELCAEVSCPAPLHPRG